MPSDADQFINWLCTKWDVSAVLSGQGWNQAVAGFGCRKSVNDYTGNYLQRFQQLFDENKDWIFGHLGYNLKTEIEQVTSSFPNEDGFDDLFFFVPEIVIQKKDQIWSAGTFDDADFRLILRYVEEFLLSEKATGHAVTLQPRQTATDYKEHCGALLKHIHRGDIYEVNYCIDFIGKNSTLDPAGVYEDLCSRSDAPFSALYRNHNSWLLCASPERFLSKQKSALMSQPIKGTRRRDNNPVIDEQMKTELANDAKERSENIMIVDLVRNDLSRIAKRGSVHVPELFGIHSFKTVHQMISTVACEVKDGVSTSEIIRATFPMGSMTGAPKINAMKIAEAHEQQSRGIYSGSVGYIAPNGDFDFNVVIRSITWNAKTGHLSAKAGSAITAKSDPIKEYEECLIKAEAMVKALHCEQAQ